MGADKASLVVDGRTMLERAAGSLAGLCSDVLVVARVDQPIPFVTTPVRVVRDRVADAGPLAGIDAALAVARSALLVVVPVDMPLLRSEVLGLMLDTAVADPRLDAVTLCSDGAMRPLPAVYRSRVASTVTRMLAEGRRRLTDLLSELTVAEIDESRWRRLDPAGRSMRNVNVPADLDVARDPTPPGAPAMDDAQSW